MTLSEVTTGHIEGDGLFGKVKTRLKNNAVWVDYNAAAEYVNKKHPEVGRGIIAKADEALAGMLILPGTGSKPAFVGNPPDWFINPVNDNEYVWLLNRMYHWKTLLQAYALTKDIRYAKKAVQELEDWIDKCVCPPLDGDNETVSRRFNSVTPWRSLEAGIRMYIVWPWLFDFLFYHDLMTPALLDKFALSVYEHGEVLFAFCPLLWPNADHNHYFMENLGLLNAAGMLPELEAASEWKSHALNELNRCVDMQFTESGGQIEGCPHYHNLCVHLVWLTVAAASRYGCTLPDSFTDKAVKAVDYSLYAQRPTGTIVPWGDSDADSGSIRAAVEGFLMFSDRKWLDIVLLQGQEERVREILLEYIWETPGMRNLLDSTDFYKASGNIRFDTVNHQYQLKQATIRTGWDKEALSLFFACRTPVNNAHAHIDPMGFDFTAYSKTLLVDPGRFCYREDESRRLFKSAAWHNTVTVNGREPFEYLSSWEYGPQKHGDITGVYRNDCIIAIEAVQYNYEPVVHRRLAAIIDGSFLLIADRFDRLQAGDSVQIYFHIDDVNVFINNDNCGANANGVRLFFHHCPDTAINAYDGLVSDSLDTARKSTRVCLNNVGGESERVFAAVCQPIRNGCEPPGISLSASVYGSGARIYITTGSIRRLLSWDSGACEIIPIH